MKTTNVFCVLFLLVLNLNAQFYLSGNITETLNLSDTVIVDGDVNVYGDGKLIFAPGSLVLFSGYYTINLSGTGQIIAAGTINDSITFTSIDTTGFNNYNSIDGGWAGININNQNNGADSTFFHYCKISYAKKLNSHGGAFKIENASKVRISNSTIQRNVTALKGGGIYLDSPSIIKNCIYYYNIASRGGGIYCKNGTVNNCIIIGNHAENYAGGLYVKEGLIKNTEITNNSSNYSGGGCCFEENVELINCLLTGNNAQYGGGFNALLFGETLILDNCIIQNNEASSGGGGEIFGMWDNIDLTGSEFKYNNALINGGGLKAEWCSFSSCLFENNTSDDGGGLWVNDCHLNNCTIKYNTAYNGGGITVFGGTVKNCLIEGNEATHSGGGAISYENPVFDSCWFISNIAIADGGGVCAILDGKFSNCIFHSNQTNTRGGGIFLDSFVKIINSIISYNHVNSLGGGVFAFDGGQLVNCLIIRNNSNGSGGGIYTQYWSVSNYCTVINSTICNNTLSNTSNSGGGIYANDDGEFINTVVWGNNTPIYTYGTNINFYYCAVQDTQNVNWGNVGLYNIINLDSLNNSSNGPNFFDPEENDYSLLNTSILINRGNPDTSGLYLPDYDLAGLPRINKDTVDIGAYEKQLPVGYQITITPIFRLFPNPASKKIYGVSHFLVKKITVYDINGFQHIIDFPNNKNFMLNIEFLTEGIYFTRIKYQGGKTIIRKFVKIL